MNPTQLKTTITPAELNGRLAAGGPVALLDVRTPGEFAAGHVPGAKLVPLGDLEAAAFLRQHDAATPLYVLCQSGGRARQAIEKFRRAGFAGCVLVEGGTQAWLDAGLPVDRGPSRALSLIRQVQITVGFLSAASALLALTVSPRFAIIPLVTGCGLLFAGLTGYCGLALVLAKMPWNRANDCGACCQSTGTSR